MRIYQSYFRLFLKIQILKYLMLGSIKAVPIAIYSVARYCFVLPERRNRNPIAIMTRTIRLLFL